MNSKPNVTFIEESIPHAGELLRAILANTKWDERMQRRLTASFGVPYNYSDMTYPEVPMPDYLQDVCVSINQQLRFLPNNCLINNYVAGNSTMGFHADSIVGLAPGTGVAIVSLGETRTLTFRRTCDRTIRWGCPLPQGSLLYMPPEVQSDWQHGVQKQAGVGQRLSLTFRALH